MEKFQGNNFEPMGEFEKRVKSSVDSYSSIIKNFQSKSKKPNSYEELISKIESEGKFIVLRSQDVDNIFKQDLENLLPEKKAKISELFEKKSKILDRIFDLASSGLNMKAFDVIMEQAKILNSKYESFNLSVDQIHALNEQNAKSFMLLYDAMKENKDKITTYYHDFLLDISKDLSRQIMEVETDEKLESIIASQTQNEYDKLVDEFLFNCKSYVQQAKEMFDSEQAENN